MALTQDISTFLTAQRVMQAPMVVSIVVNALNIALFVPMIRWYGFDGAPLALTVTNTLQVSQLVS